MKNFIERMNDRIIRMNVRLKLERNDLYIRSDWEVEISMIIGCNILLSIFCLFMCLLFFINSAGKCQKELASEIGIGNTPKLFMLMLFLTLRCSANMWLMLITWAGEGEWVCRLFTPKYFVMSCYSRSHVEKILRLIEIEKMEGIEGRHQKLLYELLRREPNLIYKSDDDWIGCDWCIWILGFVLELVDCIRQY